MRSPDPIVRICLRGACAAALVLLVVLTVHQLRAQDWAAACEFEAIERWNRFVTDANRYIEARNKGVRDVRMRGRLTKELEAALRCECF